MSSQSTPRTGPPRAWLGVPRRWWIVAVAGLLGLALVITATLPNAAAWWAAVPSLVPLAPGHAADAGPRARLYVLSSIPRADGMDGAVGGRVSVLEPATQHQLYAIETGVDVDAIPSPDGSRLYVAAVDAPADGGIGTDYLVALDTRTRAELWRVVLQNRAKYILGDGPSVMAVSPDGRWLYVFSYPWLTLSAYAPGQVPFWLEIVDTATGQILPESIPLPGCTAARMSIVPDGRTMAIACSGANDIRFLNLQTRHVEQRRNLPGAPTLGGLPGAIAGSALSPDGNRLYVVSDTFRVTVVDVTQRGVARQVDLGSQTTAVVPDGLVALSADGSRLVVGYAARRATAGPAGLRILDTSTWQEVGRVRPARPIASASIALSPDGQVVYGAGSRPAGRPLPSRDTVLAVGIAGGESAGGQMTRPGEEVTRVFVGP